MESRYMDHVIREAIEMEHHLRNMIAEDDFCLMEASHVHPEKMQETFLVEFLMIGVLHQVIRPLHTVLLGR
jgi:hypothetical protein